MKKKLLSTLLTLCLILVMAPVTALAADTAVTTEEALKAAVANGGSIMLDNDIALTSRVEITSGTVTIDLNGHTISLAEGYSSKGNCMIMVSDGASLTLNDSVGTGKVTNTSNEKEYGAVCVWGSNNDSSPTTLVVNGGTYEGYYYGVVGNGTAHNTDITINGGTMNGVNGTGIYHPQDGTLTITKGTITGADTGIELRSGTLTMTGGTVTGNGTPTSFQPNGSGTTTIGAGIAVAQHTTKKNIKVTISGGTINGDTAFIQIDPQDNNLPDTITLSITDGVFNVTNGGTKAVSSVDQTHFISGGQFTNLVPTNYITEGMAEISLASGDNTTYYIGTSDEVAAKVAEATSGDTITVHQGGVTLENVAEGVTVTNSGSGVVTVNGSEVKADGSFTVPSHTHAPSDTWLHDETQHWHACTGEGCNEKLELAAHSWDDGVVTTQPTETGAGVKTFTCTVCEYTKTEEIPATGSSEPIDPPSGPSTGSGIIVSQPTPAGTTVLPAPLPPQTGAQAIIPAICLALAAAAIFFWLARRTQRSR